MFDFRWTQNHVNKSLMLWNRFILMGFSYLSKWLNAIICSTFDGRTPKRNVFRENCEKYFLSERFFHKLKSHSWDIKFSDCAFHKSKKNKRKRGLWLKPRKKEAKKTFFDNSDSKLVDYQENDKKVFFFFALKGLKISFFY